MASSRQGHGFRAARQGQRCVADDAVVDDEAVAIVRINVEGVTADRFSVLHSVSCVALHILLLERYAASAEE